MIAIDTNVVVRFLVNDDREQARRARAMIEQEDVFVPTSVLLETEWVLRSAYGRPGHELFESLRMFLHLPRVFSQDRETAVAALRWADRGMDFADALHLASATGCDAFASFDAELRRTAANLGALTVRAP